MRVMLKIINLKHFHVISGMAIREQLTITMLGLMFSSKSK